MTVSAQPGRQGLPQGDVLHGKYEIERELGAGGYGITYLVRHLHLSKQQAVKEFIPAGAVRNGQTQELLPVSGTMTVGDFRRDIQKFFEEAERLAQFEHKNIVRVHDVFKENNTAYMVMDYERGDPLRDLCGRLDEASLLTILSPLLDGLKELHDGGMIHRDIAPDNIIIRKKDQSPVLLDFGAARQMGGGRSKSVTAVVKPDYSPPEQYTIRGGSVRQGAFTDIYALSATLYHAMTGEQPQSSTTRQTDMVNGDADKMLLALDSVQGYSDEFVNAVRAGLAIKAADRPESIDEWRAMFPWTPAQQPQPQQDAGWSGWGLAAAALAGAAVAGVATYAMTKDANADEGEEGEKD